MYLNLCLNHAKVSFVKINLKQFKGVSNYFNIAHQLPQTPLLTVKKFKSGINKEESSVKHYIDSINTYYTFYKNEISSNANLLINYISINNSNFSRRTVQVSKNTLNEVIKILPLT